MYLCFVIGRVKIFGQGFDVNEATIRSLQASKLTEEAEFEGNGRAELGRHLCVSDTFAFQI